MVETMCDTFAVQDCLKQFIKDTCSLKKPVACNMLFKLLGYCTRLCLNGVVMANSSGHGGQVVALVQRPFLKIATGKHEPDVSWWRTCLCIHWTQIDTNDSTESELLSAWMESFERLPDLEQD